MVGCLNCVKFKVSLWTVLGAIGVNGEFRKKSWYSKWIVSPCLLKYRMERDGMRK